jgi:hypothetical protein
MSLYMRRTTLRRICAALLLIGTTVRSNAQSDAEEAVQLARDGRCPEAMPLLKEAMSVVSDSDLKRKL